MSAPHRNISPVSVLRVTGLSDDGRHLTCAAEGADDAIYQVPIDDQLRALVQSEANRTRQVEIEMTSQLRPKDIQARIRAGATVEQVAAAAGCAPERIEGFAYPVLMERATVAERARAVRPLAGATIGSASAALSGRTLDDLATGTLADRGQDGSLSWDAYRDERGWTVSLTWQVGLSENCAEWAYTPGVDGGSVTPRNEAASDLIEPAVGMLRSVDAQDTTPAPAEAPVFGADTLFSTVEELPAAEPAPAPRKRGQRPAMPSWEDVLLGTRAAER